MKKVCLLFLILYGFTQITFGQNAWINEFHYQNAGNNQGQFIEIAMENGSFVSSSLTLRFYKSNGKLTGSVINGDLLTTGVTENNITLYSIAYDLGNASGICLDYDGTVIQFISVGGVITASEGIANSLSSEDIGVSESNSTPLGSSLGLTGTGTQYSDFSWTLFSASATQGSTNTNQALPVELTSFTVTPKDKAVMLNWATATEVNNYGFEIERSNSEVWEKIGFVEGHGNSYSPKEYSFYDDSPLPGNSSYRLKQIDTDGGYEYSFEAEVTSTISQKIELYQNHPNPFNPSTTISFAIPEVSLVRLTIYNAIGEKIEELVNEQFEAGHYTLNFDASYLSSGFYFYRLETPNYAQTRKMVLIK